MNLKIYLLAVTVAIAGGGGGGGGVAASATPRKQTEPETGVGVGIGVGSSAIVKPRQENENAMDLYLCSNPNFNHDCDGCACERLENLTTTGGYGGPPCYPLPEDLRVGNPQGVSSARSYSKWNCTLFDNPDCNGTLPGSSLHIPPGPPGMAVLGPFDDRAVTYQCYLIP